MASAASAGSEVYNAKNKDLLAVQQAVVRKLVAELNAFDNLYYEICNEPYERGGLTSQWNDLIVAAIVETEASLPKKHLIAQGFPPSPRAVSGLNPHVSILNFHAAKPDAVRLNYPLNKVVAFDETGGADRSDRKYRTEGWEFILAGGGVYDHLDFSFTPEHEDGMAVPLPPGTPGGGGPELRKQLRILKEFIEGFDFHTHGSGARSSQAEPHRRRAGRQSCRMGAGRGGPGLRYLRQGRD